MRYGKSTSFYQYVSVVCCLLSPATSPPLVNWRTRCRKTVFVRLRLTICQEVSAQEVPMRLLDKLSELYGDNPPGVIGFRSRARIAPDFIGGVYINDRDTLVIQIRGDSATGRKQLEEILGSKEFVVEPGLTYTQKKNF